MLIGLTIVALGTSLPELIINVFASINGNTDLAIGNVIGSNIINTLLIVGVAATIYPISMSGRKSSVDVWFSFGVTLVLFFVANFNYFRGDVHHLISRYDGLIFLILLGGFLYYSFAKGGAMQHEVSTIEFKEIKTRWSIFLIIAGAAGLFFGGKWIVSGANLIATDLGISQSAIGMTIIAAATSLPELVTSIMAAMKKNTDMAVGNAIGSNIFNILLVLGVSALINPIPFDTKMNTEIAVLLASTLLILLFIKIDFGKTRKAISKIEGILLIVAYILFLVFSFTRL
jgi:cation:H+ antiporter